MDEPSPLPEAVEAAQLWLRVHRTRSRITMHRAVEDVEYLITEAQRCADVIRDGAPTLRLPPDVVAAAQQTADGIIAASRAHLDALREEAERRAARAQMQIAKLEAAEAAVRARARRIVHRSLLALVGTDIVITVDGARHAGRVTHATRGPVLHVKTDDRREIQISAR